MENNRELQDVSTEPAPIAETKVAQRKRINWARFIAPVLLVAGVLIGYFGRPIVAPEATRSAKAVPPIVQALLAQTRHWKGSANAPVTIIEFSDFQ